MRESIRRDCGKAAIRLAAHIMKVAERLLDHDRPKAHSAVKIPGPACHGCSDAAVPGVFWPAQINGDKSQGWIERCGECRRFDNNILAAGELLRLGLIDELGIGRPKGSATDSPFADPAGSTRTARK